MSDRDEVDELFERLARRAELPLLRLSEGATDASADALQPEAEKVWRVGIGPLPPFLVVRRRGRDLDIAVDLFSPAVSIAEAVKEEPVEYVAAATGAGAIFGALVGRSRSATLIGGAVGGVIGLLGALAGGGERR